MAQRTIVYDSILTFRKTLEKTTITLSDCLACSGCVTSAESVLVNQQSLEEFEKHFETITNESVFVLSIAPQSRASLAAHYNTNITDALAKLTHFFKTHFGAKYVLDTNWSRHFTHLEICHEFIAKYHTKDTPLLARYAFYFRSNNQCMSRFRMLRRKVTRRDYSSTHQLYKITNASNGFYR
jgi:iron only hydrogenase large subunit-like protein